MYPFSARSPGVALHLALGIILPMALGMVGAGCAVGADLDLDQPPLGGNGGNQDPSDDDTDGSGGQAGSDVSGPGDSGSGGSGDPSGLPGPAGTGGSGGSAGSAGSTGSAGSAGGGSSPTGECNDEWPCANSALACCSSTCIDTQRDRNNCGECGETCLGWEDCQGGSCVPFVCSDVSVSESDNGCRSGELCYETTCRCGTGLSCGSRGECMDDVCLCGGGDPCASGQGCCEDGCTNLLTDTSNCGECGHDCEAPADACVDGQCICSSTGHPPCDGECLDLESDDQNCGACGNVCGAGSTCCGGSCVETATSMEHCGSCGEACDTRRANHCVAGECRCGDEPQCEGTGSGGCSKGILSGLLFETWACGFGL